MLTLITFLSFVLIFYTYFGYPFLLLVLPKKKQFLQKGDAPKSFSIIVAARNEEAVIQDRLRNLLDVQIPEGSSIEYLVCSDASDDGTDEIVRGTNGVKLVRSPERKGKEHAQALAVQEASGEILIFTDAKVRTEKELVVRVAEYFRDPDVGALSSNDRIEGESEGGSGEGMYVRYEMWLRRLEGEFSTLIGLSGSCFAVRKEIANNLREDIPSDFALLIETVKKGMSGVLAEDVICTYKAVKTEEQEFQRKVRTVLRGITALFDAKEIFDWQKFGAFTWQIVSHKLGRWSVPWLLLIGTVGSFELSESSSFWWLVSFCLGAFYLLALVGYFKPEYRQKWFVKVPLFFMVTNLAIAVAWIRYWRGQRAVTWSPSTR